MVFPECSLISRTKKWVISLTWGWVDGGGLDSGSGPSRNLTKLSQISSWPQNVQLHKQTKKGIPKTSCLNFKESSGYNLPFCLWIILIINLLGIILLAAATEGIFIEGVNFQRITNSKRILNSWFRFEIFRTIFSWKNAIGIGKVSPWRRFYKVAAGSKAKSGGVLGR